MTYIKRLEITAFGKFENYVSELEKGYNELVLPNEFGKSTMTDFILFMLYGFVKTTKKSVALEDNLLQKYLPWSGVGYIAGAMVIVKDGEELRIERRHQKSRQSSDAVLRDATGGELTLEKEPGEFLFGIDRDTFMRTFFVRQTDIKFKSTDGIVTALKNLVTTGDEDMSFEAARSALEDEKKKYHHLGRRTGRIYDIQKEMGQLETDIYTLERSLASLEQNKTELEALKAGIAELDAKEKTLKNSRPRALAQDARAKLVALSRIDKEYNELKARCDSDNTHSLTDADFSGASAVYSERDALTKRGAELEQEKRELDSKLHALKDGIPDYEYIKQNEADITAKAEDKGGPGIALIAAGGLLAVIGAVTAVLATPVLWAVTAVGVILALLGFIFKKKPKTDGKLISQLTLFKERKTDIELTAALIKSNEERLTELLRELAVNRGKCEMIHATLGTDNAEQLAKLLATRSNMNIVKARLSELELKRAELLRGETVEQLHAAAEIGGECGYGVAELERMLTATAQKKADLSSRAAALMHDAERALGLEREIYLKNEQLTELGTELETAKYRTRVFDIALDAMQQAYDKINKMFSPKLTEKAAEPLSLITNGRYSEVFLDRDFVIRVKADGELRELGYFSRGTADAVYFAVRRAVAELIANGNSIPLIMDDPFWSLDDERFESAREYTKKLAQSSQIIVFAARK